MLLRASRLSSSAKECAPKSDEASDITLARRASTGRGGRGRSAACSSGRERCRKARRGGRVVRVSRSGAEAEESSRDKVGIVAWVVAAREGRERS